MKTLLSFLLLFSTSLVLAQVSIYRPIDNSVLQRDNNNSSSVTIAGQLYDKNGVSSTYGNLLPTIQYRIQKLSPTNSTYISTPVNWTYYSCNYGGLFNFTVNLSGGWYQLDVQGTVKGVQAATSIKFGVGEVFIIAGQSNAQGVTNSSMYNGTGALPYDGVVADLHQDNAGCLAGYPLYPHFNKLSIGSPIAPQGPNNWCYTVLGNQIVDNTNVPVAFFNAAQQGTGARNWVESISNPNGYTNSTYQISGPSICANGGPGHPYIALKKSIQFYGSLFGSRGILWHQGENDAHDAYYNITTGAEYESRLRTIINQTRTDFGHSDLSWWISKVSRTDETSATSYITSPTILTAQGDVQTDSYNKPGPYTDSIDPRNSNDVHFTGNGLQTLGANWYNNIGGSTLTSANPVIPNSPLGFTLTGDFANGFTLQAASGFSQYYWIDFYSQLDPSAPTGPTLNYASANVLYVCYALHPNGLWYVSQGVRIPSNDSGGGTRLGVASDDEANNLLGYKVFPNPALDQTIVSFTLASPASVKLSIFDVNGNVIKHLVDANHAVGSFKYPIDTSQLPTGLYLSKITCNGLSLTKKFIKIIK